MSIDSCPGPWLSLGVHIDWQAPHVTLHIGWWQVTIGRLYEHRAGVGYREPATQLPERMRPKPKRPERTGWVDGMYVLPLSPVRPDLPGPLPPKPHALPPEGTLRRSPRVIKT